MSISPREPISFGDRPKDDAIRDALSRLELFLPESLDDGLDSDQLESLCGHLRKLHAVIRMRHAAVRIEMASPGVPPLPPELVDERHRLCEEYFAFLGQIDRLLRSVETFLHAPPEDTDVFVLRVRELIASLRRHEAEEDRLFYLAVWRDIGGES